MRTIYTGTGLRNKFLLLFVFIISITLCLSSCSFQNNTLDVIVEYQIPFAKSGSRWNENELLEMAEDPEKYYIEVVMQDKIKLYLKYVENSSFWYDIKLIFKTFWVIVKER
jgi:hypothetical protein